MKNNLYENLNNFYPVSKTLRFELKPQGRTLENIRMNDVLTIDAERREAYKKVKKYIDAYHKQYLSKMLSSVNLEGLKDYVSLFLKNKREDLDNGKLNKLEDYLRKQISQKLKSSEEYSELGKGTMITSLLYKSLEEQGFKEELKDVDLFKSFTTYFTNYFDNRKNLYSDEDKSGTIAYRLINENLPIFVRNMEIYTKFISKVSLSKEKNDNLQILTSGEKLDSYFIINRFEETLTQEKIEEYNLLIGGYKREDETQVEGLNGIINNYNQTVSKQERIPKFTMLRNQILSMHRTFSYQIDMFENDGELVEYLNKYQKTLKDFCFIENQEKVTSILGKIEDYDLSCVYINSKKISIVSQKIYKDWNFLQQSLELSYDKKNITSKSKVNEKYYEKRKKYFKNKNAYSISELMDEVNTLKVGAKEDFLNHFKNASEEKKYVENIQNMYDDLSSISIQDEKAKDLIKNEKAIEKIKKYLDVLKEYQDFVGMFIANDISLELDMNFYATIFEVNQILDLITPLYNKTRNYLTQKPYSKEKIKINFNNSTLLNGWDLNKEDDNSGILFQKDDNYFLGILNKGSRKLFLDVPQSDGPVYKKMQYKLLPGPNKMLPKVFFSRSRREEFGVSEELYNRYSKKHHIKSNENFDIKFCRELIDFFKRSLKAHPEWKEFNFTFKNTSAYNDISEFYKEVESQGYKVQFQSIPESYIDELVNTNKMYLFQLYNKDFSPYSKGKPNLHTLYWKALFSPENLKNIVYKLNGRAEVFFRQASLSLKETAIHPANEKIPNKNLLNKTRESVFPYDVVKDKRYTVDKFFLHVPITINFGSRNLLNINEEVNKEIKKSKETNIIGIDRGERNLLYICVINENGQILKQTSLNKIISGDQKVDYHSLLVKKEDERDKARKSWKTIGNIRDLKEGYLSQAVHEIVKLALEYNAIIVLEDLNYGFMNSRKNVERQVYQKFEKQLIDKLNCLVMKENDENELGGVLRPYQLANKFDSFKKLGKQSGILYYVPAWGTSKIDPVTGFISAFNTKCDTKEKLKNFFSLFDDIRYNHKEKYFEFVVENYPQFAKYFPGGREDWVVCSYGSRIERFRNSEKNNEWDYRNILLTESMMNFFEEYGIDLENIKKSILEVDEKKFYEELIRYFKLMIQMRNSNPNTDEDYLVSAVKDENGHIFDSEKANDNYPKDADANGAYNIARKGIMILQQIKSSDDLKKIKFILNNQEYLKFVQNR